MKYIGRVCEKLEVAIATPEQRTLEEPCTPDAPILSWLDPFRRQHARSNRRRISM